jgi:predicted HicB family RNase H-like nuclease
MKDPSPEKYAKALTVRISEEEHQKLKMLAVREKQTLKTILFRALDNTFPGWREEK